MNRTTRRSTTRQIQFFFAVLAQAAVAVHAQQAPIPTPTPPHPWQAAVPRLTPEAYGRNSALTTVKLPTVGILRLAAIGLGALLFALLAGDAVTSYKNHAIVEQVEELIEDLRAEAR